MQRATHRWVAVTGLCALIHGCSNDDDGGRMPGGSLPPGQGDGATGDEGADDGATGPGDDGGTDGGDGGAGTGDGDGGSGDDGGTDGNDGGVKFDIGDAPDVPGGNPDGSDEGCEKIDFLFVVDNSGSMADEQQSLANSFPGFIASIQNTVMAQDYHIMVVDSDAGLQDTCAVICQVLPDCNGIPCNMLPPAGGCDQTLGAGITKNPQGADCGFVGGSRYMVDGQPNLGGAFSCAALVGTTGDGNERPMEAMVESVTTQNAVGACNEGFVRDDAVLVVTFITDEEDAGKSLGNPASWKADLVAAKNGDEAAVVVLGLVGDPDLPGTVCPLGEAEPSPTLRTFAESFQFGSWGSICTADYAPFFDAAVSVIDTACDEFSPPG